jgi:hypothetical protein
MTILSTENRYFAPLYCVFSKDLDLTNQNNVTICLIEKNDIDFDLVVVNFQEV